MTTWEKIKDFLDLAFFFFIILPIIYVIAKILYKEDIFDWD